ncbi:MAG TPA: hypothetical protein DCX43_03680 [Psychrobacter sp.]|nr:hypothetical protein E2545_07555 [Psychrobacter sp. 230]HAV47247.1 hypothetical protein [Psychrobacter sp.]
MWNAALILSRYESLLTHGCRYHQCSTEQCCI